MSSGNIFVAESDGEIMECWPVLKELRPHLIENELLARIRQQQVEADFKLIYIRDSQGQVAGILTYRIFNKLFDGKAMYIDDFCVLSTAQGTGYGSMMMDSAIKTAKELKCDRVTLDSGYSRNKAHRFYLHKGFVLSSHHFSLYL